MGKLEKIDEMSNQRDEDETEWRNKLCLPSLVAIQHKLPAGGFLCFPPGVSSAAICVARNHSHLRRICAYALSIALALENA